MVKLNLGCGIWIKKGYINVDLYKPEDLKAKKGSLKNVIWENGAKYIQADIRLLPFNDNYADVIQMFEVIEHIPYSQVIGTLSETYRVLKKGGKLLMTAPCFDGLALDWLNIMMAKFDIKNYLEVMATIYGGQTAGGEFHNGAINPQIMNYYLTESGFRKGTMEIIPKYGPLKAFGSSKWVKGTLARNSTLLVEATK